MMCKRAFLAGLGLLVAVGCADKKRPASEPGLSSSASVMDVSAPPSSSGSAYAPAASYTPAPAPIAVEPAPVAGGSSYTVRKGDTLYSIARSRYGDGKQWKRIADANAGIQPQSLKVGQTLVIP